MRNLKKHLEKIYRKVALKLVKQGAGMPAKAAEPASQDNPVSQEALHVSGAALSPSTLLVLKRKSRVWLAEMSCLWLSRAPSNLQSHSGGLK